MMHCLEYDLSERWSSLQLYNYLEEVFNGDIIFTIFGKK